MGGHFCIHQDQEMKKLVIICCSPIIILLGESHLVQLKGFKMFYIRWKDIAKRIPEDESEYHAKVPGDPKEYVFKDEFWKFLGKIEALGKTQVNIFSNG